MPFLEALQFLELITRAVNGHYKEREVGNHSAESQDARKERNLPCKNIHNDAQFQYVRNLHPFFRKVSVEEKCPQIPQCKRRLLKIPVGVSEDQQSDQIEKRDSEKIRPHKCVE